MGSDQPTASKIGTLRVQGTRCDCNVPPECDLDPWDRMAFWCRACGAHWMATVEKGAA